MVLTSLDVFRNGHPCRIVNHSLRRYAPEQSVERAWSRLGEAHYSALLSNCEHFVTWAYPGLSPQCAGTKTDRNRACRRQSGAPTSAGCSHRNHGRGLSTARDRDSNCSHNGLTYRLSQTAAGIVAGGLTLASAAPVSRSDSSSRNRTIHGARSSSTG